MRLPVTPQISTKDGVSAKNARLTNCLKETTKRGDMAVIRPGLVTQAEATGAGGGLVAFNNELVSVYGATLGKGIDPGETTSFYTPTGYDHSEHGIAGGGLILRSAPGFPRITTSSDGITYAVVNTTDAIVIPFYANSAFYGFSIDGTKLYKSTNGGVSWSEIYDFSPYPINYSLSAEILPGEINLFSTYLGSTYKFTSSGSDTIWDGPVATAASPNGFPCVYHAPSDRTFYVSLDSPTYLKYTTDSFATAPTSTGIVVFWSNTNNFPCLAVLNDTLYMLMSDEFDQTITLYSSADGITWDSGILINDDGDVDQAPDFAMYVLGSSLVIYYSSDLTSPTIEIIDYGVGTIPPLATIAVGNYDFAQSPI